MKEMIVPGIVAATLLLALALGIVAYTKHRRTSRARARLDKLMQDTIDVFALKHEEPERFAICCTVAARWKLRNTVLDTIRLMAPNPQNARTLDRLREFDRTVEMFAKEYLSDSWGFRVFSVGTFELTDDIPKEHLPTESEMVLTIPAHGKLSVAVHKQTPDTEGSFLRCAARVSAAFEEDLVNAFKKL